jgi:hypothetical protein
MIERSGDTVSGLYRAQGDDERGFLSLASKPRSTVSPCLASKPVATGSSSLASKPVATVLLIWPQNHSLGFSGLGLKTCSYSLVIGPTKSPRWFLGLGLKTKWAMVCRLRHKTEERMKTAWDMCRDLANCFAWKRVWLRFPSLASILAQARRGWYMWHRHGGHMEMKPKTNMSMRWAASDPSTPTLPFLLYWAIRAV